jgi:PAS domain-containing protein
MPRNDGFVFYADVSTSHMMFAGETVSRWQLPDITERNHDEEKICERAKFVRTIRNTVDEGFIVIDRDYPYSDHRQGVLRTGWRLW